jgi:hypothetical protein
LISCEMSLFLTSTPSLLTNFHKQDKTWGEFSAIELAVRMTFAHLALQQNSQT